MRRAVAAMLSVLIYAMPAAAERVDLILHGGKIVTVDEAFSIAQAIAISGNKIVQVGADAEVLATQSPTTKLVDLAGKMVLPGLIDSHVHPAVASIHEFDHPIPDMHSIADVLAYIKSRAESLDAGQWIEVRQVFITRLAEQRYPTKAELDRAAPHHPVVFSTGPDAMLNSLALKECGIDRDFVVTGSGAVEKDPQTGEPTGMLRSCARYIKSESAPKEPTFDQRLERLQTLFADYNSVGLTTVSDRYGTPEAIAQYQHLLKQQKLSVRMFISHGLPTDGRLDAIQAHIRHVADHPLRDGGPMLQIIGLKAMLDGGMLTGSAYLREPWGVSSIYSITDPAYRGVLNIPPERLLPIVRTAVEEGLQFTAHAVGDGAVHTLLEVYDEIDKTLPIAETRPCLTHANFMSREAIDLAARLGVVADIQPAWLYLDARTLAAQFGHERLRYFQPLRSLAEAGVVAGGGSDHMQKIGADRAVNPYNPFLGLWVTMAREARSFTGQLHPEETLSREQAIRFYTINNAHLLFQEQRVGSLEPAKLADLIVIDRDLLTCPLDQIRETQVLATYVDGELVYERD